MGEEELGKGKPLGTAEGLLLTDGQAMGLLEVDLVAVLVSGLVPLFENAHDGQHQQSNGGREDGYPGEPGGDEYP